MRSLLSRAKEFVTGQCAIATSETSFEKRGFFCTDAAKRDQLESAGRAFVEAYNLALKTPDLDDLGCMLDQAEAVRRGFAYEGAAMALSLLDHLWGRRPLRWNEFLRGPGALQKYTLYVGYGWAVARLPWLRSRLHNLLSQHHAIEKWLILDGYGFHEGYFHPEQIFKRQTKPRWITGGTVNPFYQGVGRSLWFYCGGDPHAVARIIDSFHSFRRKNLWSGIGLAATYAGGGDVEDLITLYELAGPHRLHLAQGSAFAAQARVYGGIDTIHTNIATNVICGLESSDAAKVTQRALWRVHGDSEEMYEEWRTGVRELLTDAHSASWLHAVGRSSRLSRGTWR